MTWTHAVVATLALAILPSGAAAQANADSLLVRQLDRAEVEALLHRDSTALRRLWAPDLIVNNPRNRVTHGSEAVIELIRNGTIDYAGFEREVEAMTLQGNTAVLMGAETIRPVNRAPSAGQTVRRRFTHVWVRRDGAWRLVARHASIVTGS